MTQQTGDEVRVEITVEAPIEQAFRTFTKRGDAWWPRVYSIGDTERANVVLEPRVGGRWYELSADDTEWLWGRVLVWNPPVHLTLSWQIGAGFVPEPSPHRASRVDVRFVEDGPSRTVVTLVHSWFERHGEGWESVREAVAGEDGWPGILDTYARVAAT